MRTSWSRSVLVLSCLFGVVLPGVEITGCADSQHERQTGGLEIIAQTSSALSASDVASVVVTVTGPAIAAPIIADLVQTTPGTWALTLPDLPVGTGDTVSVTAYDASHASIYTGTSNNVAITAGQSTLVDLLLQQTTPPAPYQNSAPIISSNRCLVEHCRAWRIRPADRDPRPTRTTIH